MSSTKDEMGISTVVLTKNSETTLRECLESVRQNSPEEIVVVDGGSTDGTLDIVKEYTDRVYFDEWRGICYARQLGAEMATQEYVMYVDSDVVLQPDTMAVMLAEMKAEGWGALTGRAILDNGQLWGHAGERRGTIPMFCTVLRRELVLKHGFDPSMPNCDDFEISHQLLSHGHRIGVVNAPVRHLHPSYRSTLKNSYRCGVAIAEFLLKYWRSPRVVVKYVILRGLGSPVYGMLQSARKRHFMLIPSFALVGIVQTTGFVARVAKAPVRPVRAAGT